MSYTVNFNQVWNNADFRYVVTLKDENDAAVDLSLSTFRMSLLALGATVPAVTLTLGSGLEFFTDGTDGKLLINIDEAVMADLLGTYAYDCRMTTGENSFIPFRGKIKVKAGITALE